MRLPRPRIENCCIHVTHRCHERRLMIATDVDRKQYVKRLWQASRKFRAMRILDYVVTSNHVHILAWVPRMDDLSGMMKWLQGTYAGDYNRRVGREGAFWRGRFHPTLVETGRHLSRCLFYLDMNMVRAGVVDHPRRWRFGGYHELNGTRQRYRIIDQERLLDLLAVPDIVTFRDWYEATLTDLCRRPEQPKEPYWGRALAVGSRNWLNRLGGQNCPVEEYIRPLASETVDDPEAPCVLNPPQSAYLRIWDAITAKCRR